MRLKYEPSSEPLPHSSDGEGDAEHDAEVGHLVVAVAEVEQQAGHSCGRHHLCHHLRSGSEEGSYLRLIDFCITQLLARE